MQFDLSREWLETNGIGGFASSTVIGANTRRYHALLCAATRAPQERAILVSKADETLSIASAAGGEEHYALGVNIWPGEVSPQGYNYLAEFHLDPLPRWVYQIPHADGLIRLQKTLWMPAEHNTTVIEYILLEGPPSQLSIRPFVTGRDYHSTHRFNGHFNTRPEVSPGIVAMKPYAGLPWAVFSHEGQFFHEGAWYYDFEWPIEQERGLDSHEDAYSPGTFVLTLEVGQPKHFMVSTTPQSVTVTAATKEREIERRTVLAEGREWNDPQAKLRLGADQFIVRREDGLHTILAGYPWFTDWGRDTMIALPGLCLTTGRYDIARSILLSFAGAMSGGMIPNRFPEAGETPDYNTVDATLWFFHAVSQYGEISGDWETVGTLYPRLVESIEWHLTGTRFGIQADDEDGLLNAGDPNSQLTWMDAKVGDVAFTPRNGKPVEIQALWFNALRFMAQASKTFGNDDMAGICGEWSRKIAGSFPDLFWNEAEGCLYDCINGAVRDPSVRPNQALAVSLPHRLLPRDREIKVIDRVRTDLLTPHGLRSLSPKDKRYRGIYKGDQWARDSSYHQGTVWAWPIGPFLTGYLKVNEYSAESKVQVREWLQPLLQHLDEAGLNSISEIFDGDPPYAPRGCFAQAWSVSEVLRVLEDAK